MALEKLYNKQEKMEALGVDKESVQWKSLKYDIENAEASLDRYNRAKRRSGDFRTSLYLPQNFHVFRKPFANSRCCSFKDEIWCSSEIEKEIQTQITATIKRIPVIGKAATEASYIRQKHLEA